MHRPLLLLACLPLALLLFRPDPAAAQGWGRGGGGAGRIVQQPPPLTDAPRADNGPRLEPGAALCRTAEDLGRRAAVMAARAAGTETTPVQADCVIVNTRTSIEILRRAGTGRTEVRTLAAPQRTGWTDAWLPQRPGGR